MLSIDMQVSTVQLINVKLGVFVDACVPILPKLRAKTFAEIKAYFLTMMSSSNRNIFRVTGPLCIKTNDASVRFWYAFHDMIITSPGQQLRS